MADIKRASQAITGIESGGNYRAIGPVTRGDRAYGKYQVMGANVGPWTEQHYGKRLTPEEFLANPDAQEAVFKGEFGRLAEKYGEEGAARAWFAGEGGMNNPNAADVNGMTVARYAQLFNQGGGGGGAGATPTVDSSLPPLLAQSPLSGLRPEQIQALMTAQNQAKQQDDLTKQGMGLLAEATTTPKLPAMPAAQVYRPQAQPVAMPSFTQQLAQNRLMRRT